MQACPRGRLGHAENPPDLGVGKPTGELQGDQIALTAVERTQGGAHGLAAQRQLGVVVGAPRARVLVLTLQAGAVLAPAQLVERGVAGDPEQPPSIEPRPDR